MVKRLFFGVLALGVSGAALAQTADAPNWSGPYAGIHAGYGFDDGSPMQINGNSAATANAVASGARPTLMHPNRAGFVGGGQIGWNFQRGRWVFGPEGDFSYLHTRGTTSALTPTTTGPQQTLVRNRIEWMGSARLRAGYTLGDGLIYATGGYAFGKVKGSAAFNSPTGAENYTGGNSYTAQGWIAGAGAELRPWHEGAMSKVSFGVEATYYDLGRSNITARPTTAALATTGTYNVGRDTRGVNGVFKVNYAF